MPTDTLNPEELRNLVVEQARKRRVGNAQASNVRTEWFINEVLHTIGITLQERVLIATEMLKNKIIINISRPVTKKVVTNSAGQSRTIVSDRSTKGEYPKADTTLLQKTIFSAYDSPAEGVFDGYVGTPVDYGVILEVSKDMDRSFLVRTLIEEQNRLARVFDTVSA